MRKPTKLEQTVMDTLSAFSHRITAMEAAQQRTMSEVHATMHYAWASRLREMSESLFREMSHQPRSGPRYVQVDDVRKLIDNFLRGVAP